MSNSPDPVDDESEGGSGELFGPNTPVHFNATYLVGQRSTYGRDTNPTWESFERDLGRLEGGGCLAFASGQAALHSIISLVGTSSKLWLGRDTYNGTRRLTDLLASEGRLEVEEVEEGDLRSMAFLSRAKSGDVLMLESPSNPSLNVYDVKGIANASTDRGVMVCVDNTFATPLGQQPLRIGADIVVHSTTKFLSGHSDVLGGAIVVSDDDLLRRLHLRRTLFGAVPGPMETYLIHRGMKTLRVRLEASSRNAYLVAKLLAEQFGDDVVRYPGLPSHPDYAVAKRTLRSFGAIVTLDLQSAARADRFLSGLRLFTLATSLGGVESLAERRAKHPFEHHTPVGLIRFSLGIEDAEVLLGDLRRAIALVS